MRAAAIGALAGLRSMTPAAALRNNRPGKPEGQDTLGLAMGAVAGGELVADKLPMIPPRTSGPALAFRALSGGMAGSALAGRHEGGRRYLGFIAGAVAAVGASYAGEKLRARLGPALHLPDPLVALLEDAIAVGGAIALARQK